jgi:hypothetical protein
MVGTKSLLVAIAAPVVVSASLYGESNLNHSCVLQTPLLSCTPPTLLANASKALDSCCVETFGGLFLATQFWSTYTGLESKGQLLPKDSWCAPIIDLILAKANSLEGQYTGFGQISATEATRSIVICLVNTTRSQHQTLQTDWQTVPRFRLGKDIHSILSSNRLESSIFLHS